MMPYPSTQPGHPTPEELDVLSQFAYRFSVPILVRTRDDRNRVETSGGSGLAVLIGGRKRIVTAQHVVDCYRARYRGDSGTLFHCGNATLDPDRRIVGEDDTSDIVVLDVDDLEIIRDQPGVPPLEFFEPEPWPGNDVCAGDSLFFGGWPGAYREVADHGLDVYLGYDSIVNVQVTGTSEHEFRMQFDRSKWSRSLNDDHRKPHDYVQDRQLGGHSGAAVYRISPTGERPELVGFVKQDRGDYDDAVICCPVTKIRGDGTVKPSSIGYSD
jgi:hypothetical protein